MIEPLGVVEAPDYTIEQGDDGLYRSITSEGRIMVTGMNEDNVRWRTDNVHIPLMTGVGVSNINTSMRTAIKAGSLRATDAQVAAAEAIPYTEADGTGGTLYNTNIDNSGYTGYSNPWPYPEPTPSVEP